MAQSPSLLVTIFAFLLVLGPLVLVHELGHYLVGRLFGVKADAFSIGFGKELAGWTDKRGTRWKLSALPLGGYVQFAGDMNAAGTPDRANDGLSPEERAQTFQVKPLWQRALIVLAGPLTNLVVAVAIFAAFFLTFGNPVAPPEVAGFLKQSDARTAGMVVGDRIVAIDGAPIESATEISQYVAPYPGRTISVAIEREGRGLVVPVRLTAQNVQDRFGNRGTIADLGVGYSVPIVSDFSEGSPAQAAGIKKNDRILAIEGAKIETFADVLNAVTSRPGEVVAVKLRRAGHSLTVPVRLESVGVTAPDGRETRIGRLGISITSGEFVSVGLPKAVSLAWERTVGTMRLMVTGITQIVSGQQFSLGWLPFVEFAALISINLAFINLLPIPGLDGGHLAFYAAEAVRRKPLGIRSQEWALRTGLAFVLALMLFVTINDIAGLKVFGG